MTVNGAMAEEEDDDDDKTEFVAMEEEQDKETKLTSPVDLLPVFNPDSRKDPGEE